VRGSHLLEKVGLTRRAGFPWKLERHLHVRAHIPPGGAISRIEEKFNGSQETNEKDQGPEEGKETRSGEAAQANKEFVVQVLIRVSALGVANP
jgi:hypothetical protein